MFFFFFFAMFLHIEHWRKVYGILELDSRYTFFRRYFFFYSSNRAHFNFILDKQFMYIQKKRKKKEEKKKMK